MEPRDWDLLQDMIQAYGARAVLASFLDLCSLLGEDLSGASPRLWGIVRELRQVQA